MLRKLVLLFVCALFSGAYTFAQVGAGTVKGTVKDESGEPLPFVNVGLFQNGVAKGGAPTDINGKFIIQGVTPGEYDVEVTFVGYAPTKVTGVVVNSGKITFLDKLVLREGEMLDVVEVIEYEVPLINKDGGSSGGTVTREDISKMATRSASGVAATVGGVVDDGGGLSVRGSRSENTYYYIDGIKVRGSTNLPKSALQEVTVITGGLPASYGDVTGGVISITTRGPSSRFFGSIEAVTSGFYIKGQEERGYDGKSIGLDPYAYNLVEGMVSGPLFFKKDSTGKKTKPILGFLISANYTDQMDPRPVAGGMERIKQDVLDEILANPLRPTGTGQGTYYNSDFLRTDDFETVKYRMNARSRTVSAAGKIDVNAGPSINLTFGGSLNYNWASIHNYTGSLYNFFNFGNSTAFDWRVYGRFTQRFSADKDSKSKIKSAQYSIMVDYTKTNRLFQDDRHEDRFFNYGYVGRFKTYKIPTYAYTGNGYNDSLIHDGFRDTLVEFTPSEVNSSFAAITQQYYSIYADRPAGNYENLTQINAGNALRNGDAPQSVYGIWTNAGTPYNGYGKYETEQFRVTASGTMNIGDHALSLGFEYEQRWDRGFESGQNGPISLWTVARQYMNDHIKELDENSATWDFYGTFPRVTYDRLNAGYGAQSGTNTYGGAQNADAQYFFDYNIRKELGLDPFGTDWVDIDDLDPNLFRLDMFSADELFNSGGTFFEYWGYDHTGKRIKATTDIDNYFSEFDENGNYKRTIGSFQPIYVAGYLMDKFAFDDIIFNVGVRVDVFDANQPVLKDKYLVYSAYTAGEVSQFGDGTDIIHPESIGDDYTVYVDKVDGPTTIRGYRSGDTWYDANGVEVTDPTTLEGANGIAPWLIDPTAETPTGDAFEDYKPQINIMPRIAFSFPISDEASFFAHYDILTQRPTTGFRFNPIDYQFMEARNVIINNPNLRPERTVDYEIGFQQVLGKTSSIKISAFYKEMRDQIQLQNIFSAYPVTYRTYGNRDFGTVKGITVSYDLRRTKNIRMTANYTLQFADGTGSNAGSALNLVNSGQPNLRVIFPLDYDRRHNFNVVFDYRFGEGKDYNGPTTKKGGQPLANFGLNVTANVGSGSPYSSARDPYAAALINPGSASTKGSVNGSRLPWNYRLDIQIDKSFALGGKEKSDGSKGRVSYLQIYLRLTNILGTRNVIGVYRYSGTADDDGYLAAAQFQAAIQNQLDEQSFRDLYSLKVQNPYNWSVPRTIRLGLKFDF